MGFYKIPGPWTCLGLWKKYQQQTRRTSLLSVGCSSRASTNLSTMGRLLVLTSPASLKPWQINWKVNESSLKKLPNRNLAW